MLPEPTISVILPVFNAAKYVRAALESVLAQSFGDLELLVIDDGSTDESLELIQQATQYDSRCRVISQQNRGIVFSCNHGIELARGKYIFRMDADDIARPRRLEHQIAYLRAHPECVAVGTRVMLIDPDDLPIREMSDLRSHDEIDAAHLRGLGGCIIHPTVGMRADALIRVGGYRPAYEWAEDLDLFLRLAEVGQLANLPQVLLDYRQHLASVGYARQVEQWRRNGAAVADARRRRGLPQREEALEPERSGRNASSADHHRKWAWWALQGGNPKTARKHAFRALRLDPLSSENARLLACALRGR